MQYDKAFYESLPAKRMGAGCLFFNDLGQVMLLKPAYKPGWEIPGGIVEKDESPRECCQREVNEELGLKLDIGELLVVDYNSKAGEKTESLQFIFNGGMLTTSQIESIKLDPKEVTELVFFDTASLPEDMAAKLRNRVRKAIEQLGKGNGVYIENQG